MKKKKLNKSEVFAAEKLKGEFADVREKITKTQAEMEELSKKAEFLIGSLEDLRAQEQDFIRMLEEKYGKGKLDPFNLIYEIDEYH